MKGIKDEQCQLPDGVSEWDLWFDVSRLRPDEWEQTMAGAFLRPLNIQAAYQSGINDANDDHRTAKGQQD